MATTENDGKFLKGITTALGLIVIIQSMWSFYTQSNRFTSADAVDLKLEMKEYRKDSIEALWRELGMIKAKVDRGIFPEAVWRLDHVEAWIEKHDKKSHSDP